MKRLPFAASSALLALLCTSCNIPGLVGLPGPQDGTWLTSSTQLGAATYILFISLDKIARVNVNGVEWTVQQSYAANRVNNQITWKVIAQPPAGLIGILPAVNTQYDFVVTPQADGTLSGTATQGISTVPGFASIPTGSFPVTMRRI